MCTYIHIYTSIHTCINVCIYTWNVYIHIYVYVYIQVRPSPFPLRSARRRASQAPEPAPRRREAPGSRASQAPEPAPRRRSGASQAPEPVAAPSQAPEPDGMMFDDIFGDDHEATAARTPRRFAAPGNAASDPRERCHLCQDMIDGVGTQFHGFDFHRECQLAVRSYRRLVGKGGTTIVAQADRQMRDDPEAWRSEVLPLRTRGPDGRRDAAARARVTASIEEHTRECSRVDDQVLLTKRRYKGFMRQWEGVDSPTASSDFEKVGEEQGWRHNRDGVQYVAVADNPRLHSKQGTVKRQRTSEDRSGAVAAAAADAFPAEPRGRRERDSARERRRGRSATPGSDGASTVRGGAGFGARGGSSSMRGRSSGSLGPYLGSGGSPSAEPPRTRPSGSPPPAGAREGRGSTAAEVGGTPGKMSPVEFIQQKTSMTVRLSAVLAIHTGSRGVVTKIEANLSKLAKDQVESDHMGGKTSSFFYGKSEAGANAKKTKKKQKKRVKQK